MSTLEPLSYFEVSAKYPDALQLSNPVGYKIIVQKGVDRKTTIFSKSDLIYVYCTDYQLVTVTERLVRERCSYMEWNLAKVKSVLMVKEPKAGEHAIVINIEGDFIDISKVINKVIKTVREEGDTYEDYKRKYSSNSSIDT